VLNRIWSKLRQADRNTLLGLFLRNTVYNHTGGKDSQDNRPNITDELKPTLETPEYLIFQESPQKALRRYISIECKKVLEIGGSQACISANAFLRDGADSVTVTGLDHITEETISFDQRIKISRANGLELENHFAPDSFDVVYGLSIIEHVHNPKRFVEQVHYVLKPGGFAYFEGNPLWSSPKGHHLWVASWGGNYMNKTSANYLFSEFTGTVSSNPIPDWGHLLLSKEELKNRLNAQSIPESDIACIVHWIYDSDEVNRLSLGEICEAYTNSGLTTLEANMQRVDIPEETLIQLRQKHGDGIDYGVSGITFILKKE